MPRNDSGGVARPWGFEQDNCRPMLVACKQAPKFLKGIHFLTLIWKKDATALQNR